MSTKHSANVGSCIHFGSRSIGSAFEQRAERILSTCTQSELALAGSFFRMDYRAERYYISRYLVKQLTVVGKAAESFWSLAFRKRRGLSTLLPGEVATVDLYNVTNAQGRTLGTVTFKLSEEDSKLAHRLALAVVTLLERHGFRILDGVASRLDAAGNEIGGEHDLVCERRQSAKGASSVEVKCRQIKTKGLRLEDVRRQVQRETWKPWPTMKSEAGRTWSERVYVLVVWGAGDEYDLGTWSATYAEAIPASVAKHAPDAWAPLWGWTEPVAATPTRQEPSPALQRTKAKQDAAFERALRAVRRCTLHGKRMGSVSDLLKSTNTPLAKKVRPTIGEKMHVWSKRWRWPVNSYGKHASAAARGGGGSEGRVAADAALRDIFSLVPTAKP